LSNPVKAVPAWKNDRVKVTKQLAVFDTADLAAESTFWAGLLGGTVNAEDDWHTVYVDGSPQLAFQLAPDHVPPQWPDGTPQQIHFDLFVDDIKAAHDEATALGARLLDAATDLDAAHGYRVYADPAGHPFCLCWE
jgi:catechol 2,3-dioxygenase-like lactoylglutathione lyase family enzyme